MFCVTDPVRATYKYPTIKSKVIRTFLYLFSSQLERVKADVLLRQIEGVERPSNST